MPSYNYSFSTGEVGIGNSNAYGNDRSLDLLVAENLLPDDRYNWNPRGGSKFVDKVPQALEWLQNGEYIVMKFANVIKVYYQNKLKFYFKYEYVNGVAENFAIGGLMVDCKVSYKVSDAHDCIIGFGIYRRENFLEENFSNGSYVKVQNLKLTLFNDKGQQLGDSKTINSDTTNFLRVGTVSGKNGIQLDAVKLGDGQIVDAILWCGQTILLTIKNDFVMYLYFSSPISTTTSSTDSSFAYSLSKKAGYQFLSVYNSGFVIYGLSGAVGFYTSTQTQNAVFEADNVRGDLFIFQSAVDDLTTYDSFCCLKPRNENGIRLIYLTYPLRNNSTSFYLPHTTSSSVRSIDVIKDYQIRFLILFTDGTIDVVSLFQGDNNNYIYLVSRISFYEYVGRIIGTYGSKFWFLINDDFQMLDFSSSVYLDNFSDYSIPAININPISYDYELGVLRNYNQYGMWVIPTNMASYTFVPDANVNDVRWGAITCRATFDIVSMIGYSQFNLYIDNSVIINNRQISVFIDASYKSNNLSPQKSDFTLQIFFKVNGSWSRIFRTIFTYNDKDYSNKAIGFDVTNKNATPKNNSVTSRFMSYNSPDQTFTRDLGGNIFTNPEDIENFQGFVGYLIPYKFVYFDPIMQGNLLYDMPKSSICLNWRRFGKGVSYTEVNELYVDSDYPKAKMSYENKINSATPPIALGGSVLDSYNSWKTNNQKVVHLIEFSDGDCLFRYGSICSFEPFGVFSGNTFLPKTRNRAGEGG